MERSEQLKYEQELYDYLSGFLSEDRKSKFEAYIADRTRYVTIVVEDIYQPHNASAVLRSAECLGVQDVHIIESRNKYSPSKEIVKGANKWLTLHHHRETEQNTLSCIEHLKKNGYRIAATTPHTNDQLIEDLDLSKGKVALFFGTELDGISKQVIDAADEFVKIPMYGFTESFNISVSAAVCMYETTKRLRASDLDWRLREEERIGILLEWAKSSLTKPELYEQEFRKMKGY